MKNDSPIGVNHNPSKFELVSDLAMLIGIGAIAASSATIIIPLWVGVGLFGVGLAGALLTDDVFLLFLMVAVMAVVLTLLKPIRYIRRRVAA